MARHLKSIVQNRLKCAVSYYAPHSDISASHRRGVRYFVPVTDIDMLWGAMNTVKEGYHFRKHIIVRRLPRRGGQLLQLYTYHFPKTWSAACLANRELIKTAQRMAHALEHDHSLAAMEWRIRFFRHYFRVFQCGEAPETGMKRYSRFYQYTYVAIYRELQAARRKDLEPAVVSEPLSEDLSFEPLSPAATAEPLIRRPRIRGAFNRFAFSSPPTLAPPPLFPSLKPACAAAEDIFLTENLVCSKKMLYLCSRKGLLTIFYSR